MSDTSLASLLNPQSLQSMLSSSSKDAGIAQKTLESGLVDKEKAIDTAAPIQKEGADATRKDREAYDKKADNYHDQLEQVDTWKPEKQQSDPISAFGQAGTVFALLAAGLTHAPMANALNAAASAINARRANDDAGYQKAFDAWKENTKLALDKNEAYLNHLNILGAKAKTDPESYISEAKLAAAQYDDKGALKLIASGQYEDLAKLNDARAKNQVELQKAYDDVHDAHEESQLKRDAVKALGPDATPDQIATTIGSIKAKLSGAKAEKTTLSDLQAQMVQGRAAEIIRADPKVSPSDALLQANDEVVKSTAAAKKAGGESTFKMPQAALDLAADTWIKTGVMPNLGQGKDGNSARAQVVEVAAERLAAQGKDASDMILGRVGLKANENSLNNQTKIGDSLMQFENTAVDNMGVVQQYLDEGAAKDGYQVFNSWQQAGRRATSDTSVRQLDTALRTVADEYGKIMTGATGAAGLPVSIERTQNELLNSSYTPDNIRGVFDTMKQDIANRRTEVEFQKKLIEKSIQDGTGTSRPDAKGSDTKEIPKKAVDMLKASPDTAAHFDEIFGAGAAKRILGQ